MQLLSSIWKELVGGFTTDVKHNTRAGHGYVTLMLYVAMISGMRMHVHV